MPIVSPYQTYELYRVKDRLRLSVRRNQSLPYLPKIRYQRPDPHQVHHRLKASKNNCPDTILLDDIANICAISAIG